MFWGLALESGKRYAKTVENPFRISQAVLDTTTADNEIVRVMVDVDDTETLLCNLSLKHGILQCPLDLQFLEGENIALYAFGGTGQVHLSGYILPEEGDESMFGDEEEEDLADEEDVSSDEEVPVLVAPSTSGKRKPDVVANPIPTKKSKIQDVESVKPTKVTVCEMIENAVKDQDDDDDEDDDDYDEGEEEEGSDEEGEEEGESDDEEMEDEDEEEDEEVDADANETPKAEVKTPKAEVKTPKAEVKTPKAEAKTPKAEVKTPKAEVKTEIKEVTEEKEKSGSEMDTSITEVKSPSKKEKKKKKRESLAAINGEAPATPVQKKEEKPDEAPKTPKQKDISLDKTPGKLDKTPKALGKIETPGKSPSVTKAGGVLCEDITVGAGQEAKNGRMVAVYYEGRLKSNNKLFDSTLKGAPFKFRLGSGEVIKGWDVGVNGMKIGGKRRVVCPPHMAYGKRGAPPDIPKNATLTFTIELKGIN